MSYTTNVRVHTIRSNGSIETVNFTFTNEKEAYTFYLKANHHDCVESVDFPDTHLKTYNNKAEALSDLEFFAG